MSDQNASQPYDSQPGAAPPGGTSSKGSLSPALIIGLVVLIGLLIVAIVLVLQGNSGGTETPAPPEVVMPTPLPESPSATAKEAINVRSGPGTQYPSYGVAPKGAQAPVIGVSADGLWWVVQIQPQNVAEGRGWVSGDYVEVVNADAVPVIDAPPPPPPVDVEPPEEGKPVATALDYIHVRTGPGVDYPSYGVAAPGAQAEVIGISEEGDWWVVKVPTSFAPDGRGWVSADWVEVKNVDDVPVVPAP